MSNKEDKLLEEYLQGKSELSRLYAEEGKDTVPEYLDEAILAAAKMEVGTGPKPSLAPFSSSWQIPMSLAAVLVLSVGLVLTLYDERGESYLKEPLSTTDKIVPQATSPMVETKSIGIEKNDIAPIKEQSEFHDDMTVDGILKSEEMDSKKIDLNNNISPAETQAVETTSKEAAASEKIKNDKDKGRAGPGLGESEDRAIYIEEQINELNSFDDVQTEVQSIEEAYAPKIEKPSRLNSSPSQKRMEQLVIEVEELNQTQKEIQSERDQLKRELESVEVKQMLLKKKISRERMPSSLEASSDSIISSDAIGEMVVENGPANEQLLLENILQLWNENRKQEALQQLGEFMRMFPEYPPGKLQQVIPDELLQLLPTHDGNQ